MVRESLLWRKMGKEIGGEKLVRKKMGEEKN
jgi:hypothetical protein